MATRTCLYCQRSQPAQAVACDGCGMPLPTDRPQQRRQRRFLWFCVALSVFCLAMIVWLPRSL